MAPHFKVELTTKWRVSDLLSFLVYKMMGLVRFNKLDFNQRTKYRKATRKRFSFAYFLNTACIFHLSFPSTQSVAILALTRYRQVKTKAVFEQVCQIRSYFDKGQHLSLQVFGKIIGTGGFVTTNVFK